VIASEPKENASDASLSSLKANKKKAGMSAKTIPTSQTPRAGKAGVAAGDPAKIAKVKPHGGPGVVRIVGGRWKRTPLVVSAISGLRPTPQRVRETLFNWLGADLGGWRCVDAFAGTGALGFEAASRGAEKVTLCESSRVLLLALSATHVRLDEDEAVELHAGDGLKFLKTLAPGSVDLIFLDPPFDDEDVFEPALAAAARAVSPEGFIYLETPQAWTAQQLQKFGLVAHRHQRAGMVHGHLLMPLADD
jgi:16S rRNA (guanine966-N2)-methyltransferase